MDGGLLPWGDGKAVLDAVKQIAVPTPLGRILGGGTAVVKIWCQARLLDGYFGILPNN
jgi:aldehyde:ferredoxin oxidoreductase